MKYNLEKGSHTVYALQYHFVTVTKYRSDILTDEIAERLGEIASDIAADFGVNIQNVNGGSDQNVEYPTLANISYQVHQLAQGCLVPKNSGRIS